MKKSNDIFFGQIRIISGQWKGRKLPVLRELGLRPTTDRMKETLFNWLSSSIINARCLDCFAGSGALGLEALSRNAANVTLLEIKQSIVRQLQKNIILLKASNIKIINVNTFFYLNKNGVQHNIVFIDPPFYKGLLGKTFNLLEKNGWLSDNALIYVECEIEINLLNIPINWILYREKTSGRVSYRLYLRKKSNDVLI